MQINLLCKASNAFLGIHKGFSPPGDKPETKPEESINFEIGYRKNSKNLQTEIIGYLSDYSNLLGADLAATGGSGTNELFNAGEAVVKGIEFLSSINVARNTSKLKLPVYFNYTFTDAKFNQDYESAFDPWGGEIKSGYKLPYISKHLISLGAELNIQEINLNIDYSYKSKFRTRPGLDMNDAKDIMKNELMNITINKPIIPIIQNTTVDVTEDVEIIKNNLVNQVTATVRWRETMEKFKELGVDSIIEVGAGNVLTNLAKRSTPNLQRFTLNSKESLENFMRDYSIV